MIKANEHAPLFAEEYLASFQGAGEMHEVMLDDSPTLHSMRVYALYHVFLFPSGLVVGKNGMTIQDCMARDDHISKCLEQINTNQLVNKIAWIQESHNQSMASEGEYVPLIGPWCTSFWHWMMEFTPKVLIAEAHGFTGKYIISPSSPDFIRESLGLLDIAKERVVLYDTKKHFLIEKIILPQRIKVSHDVRFLCLLRLLRKKFLANITLTENNPKRIYLSRRNASNGREIVNEARLLKVLYEFGFQDFSLQGMPLKNQIQLMAKAQWLVSGNGGAVFHCLFMPEASYIIELFSPTYVHPGMLTAIELLKHNYFMITSYNDYDYKFGDDIEAYIDLVKLTIQNQIYNHNSRLR